MSLSHSNIHYSFDSEKSAKKAEELSNSINMQLKPVKSKKKVIVRRLSRKGLTTAAIASMYKGKVGNFGAAL
jgi:CRISPR/Cas system-associated protein Cas5 (RAMP superfamily)